ncbi:MAG: zinc-finger-containing protein [Comamonas sp.]|uniref:zinc-finger-containing protein n=1 Tax=Comamonas sp. TaxID=34028 RepID=UPI003D1232C9
MTVICDYCQRPAALVSGTDVYPHRPDLNTLKFWKCAGCKAWVGCHKNSADHAPLGRLADAKLRAAKSAAHAAFDPLWKSGEFSRSGAYSWLAARLGIAGDKCHIGMFDLATCSRVVNVVSERKEAA